MSKRPGDPGYAACWCIHYRYNRSPKTTADNTCEAGVRFDTFDPKVGPGFPRYVVQPCFLSDKGESKPDAMPCEHLRRPTPEEIAAHEQWAAERMNELGKVMTAILPWRKEQKAKRVGASKVMDCPACNGAMTLSLSISGYNGHVHGRCSTAGCVSWME